MSGMDVPAQLQIQAKINTTFTELKNLTQLSYQLDMTGVPLFAVATQTMMEKDII